MVDPYEKNNFYIEVLWLVEHRHVDAPAPKTIYEPGEVIRVCDGPFNDFNGVVEYVDYERNIVKVSVQILGRATPVELDFIQIEKT